ncbi:hypothetical protein J1N35_014953 [Gossypium stocksii]|uniref:PUB 12/19-like N-terminal domain-containing protein n=1 Tax=Gossypium stocksii TaxID=47602 RepID=A0A9D4AAE0_9ROSI|nr:hypothetical protein J1N35_014953 [Gossypium stocksii]
MVGGVASAQEGDAARAFLLLMELTPPLPLLLYGLLIWLSLARQINVWSPSPLPAISIIPPMEVPKYCPIPMRYMEAGESFREIPYHRYQISEEVQEQVSLVKAQLRRSIERYGSFNSRKVSNALSQPLEKQCGSTNGKISAKLDIVSENCDRTSTRHGADQTTKILERVNSSSTSSYDCI